MVLSSPRTRGCSPRPAPPRYSQDSSPRTRGCSQESPHDTGHSALLPAHAGVFPQILDLAGIYPAPPRARGGVPRRPAWRGAGRASSPRTRGCSQGARAALRSRELLPAHAGVFPNPRAVSMSTPSPPRARGGVPADRGRALWDLASSPRTRGCSQLPDLVAGAGDLLPAHAGVFPAGRRSRPRRPAPPRARGGVPGGRPGAVVLGTSSPRTRGCSRATRTPTASSCLLPAHAGVFPVRRPWRVLRDAPPRARGGVPRTRGSGAATAASSPRTRGCSRGPPRRSGWRRLLPAHAGVFPG